MRHARTTRLTTAGLVTLALVVPLTATPAAAARPDFQLPFPCGETWRPETYSAHAPNAIDFNKGVGADDLGEEVVASAGGTVEVTLNNSSYGNYVVITHGSSGWNTIYAHLQSVRVADGDTVRMGEQIGTVGSTGNSTSPHLHYEQRTGGYRTGQPALFDGRSFTFNTPITSKNCAATNPDRIDRNIIGTGDRDDLALLTTGHTLYYATGNGDGSFDYREQIFPRGGVREVALGDVTGDGNPDLVLLEDDGTVKRASRKGTADGTFNSVYPEPMATAWGNMSKITVADVSGDGHEDLVGVSEGGKIYYSVLDETTRTFGEKKLLGSGAENMVAIAAGDIAAGDRAEVVGLSAGGSLYAWDFPGPGEYWPRTLLDGGWDGMTNLAIGDWNGDEQTDFVGIKGTRLYKALATGDRSFATPTATTGGLSDWSVARDLG